MVVQDASGEVRLASLASVLTGPVSARKAFNAILAAMLVLTTTQLRASTALIVIRSLRVLSAA